MADLLVRAGIGALTLVDRDTVEWTNLQRQLLFDEEDVRRAMPKAAAARERLLEIDSAARLKAVVGDLGPANAEAILEGGAGDGPAALIIDGTDNYETRYLLNDLAVKRGVPLVYGGAVASEGLSMTVLPGAQGSACLRCVFPEPPAVSERRTCDTAGVLGPAVAMVGAWQAAEAIKILAGRMDLLSGRLSRFDLERGAIFQTSLAGARDPSCPCCARRRFEYLEGGRQSGATTLCGRNSVQIAPPPGSSLDLARLAESLRAHGPVVENKFLVRAVLEQERPDIGDSVEITAFADGRAIIAGAVEAGRARAIYARYIGA